MKDRAGSRPPTILFVSRTTPSSRGCRHAYSWLSKTTTICCEVKSERYLDFMKSVGIAGKKQ